MKQKAKKQQAMLKKVEEQMHEKDEELQKRLVSYIGAGSTRQQFFDDISTSRTDSNRTYRVDL